MTLQKFIAGLQILSDFYDEPDGYHTSAEHDVFYADATDKPLDAKSLARMVELGWFQEVERPDDGEFTTDCYDPEESWAAFT